MKSRERESFYKGGTFSDKIPKSYFKTGIRTDQIGIEADRNAEILLGIADDLRLSLGDIDTAHEIAGTAERLRNDGLRIERIVMQIKHK